MRTDVVESYTVHVCKRCVTYWRNSQIPDEMTELERMTYEDAIDRRVGDCEIDASEAVSVGCEFAYCDSCGGGFGGAKWAVRLVSGVSE